MNSDAYAVPHSATSKSTPWREMSISKISISMRCLSTPTRHFGTLRLLMAGLTLDSCDFFINSHVVICTHYILRTSHISSRLLFRMGLGSFHPRTTYCISYSCAKIRHTHSQYNQSWQRFSTNFQKSWISTTYIYALHNISRIVESLDRTVPTCRLWVQRVRDDRSDTSIQQREEALSTTSVDNYSTTLFNCHKFEEDVILIRHHIHHRKMTELDFFIPHHDEIRYVIQLKVYILQKKRKQSEHWTNSQKREFVHDIRRDNRSRESEIYGNIVISHSRN